MPAARPGCECCVAHTRTGDPRRGWRRRASLVLLEGLAGAWVKGDGCKGYKVIHLYRTGCGEPGRVEMHITPEELEAMGVMAPFVIFLRLMGQVPGETASCPGHQVHGRAAVRE